LATGREQARRRICTIALGVPEVLVRYEGTLVEKVNSPAFAGSLASRELTAELKWIESVRGPIDQIEYTGIYGASSIHWHVDELSGKVTDRSSSWGFPVALSNTEPKIAAATQATWGEKVTPTVYFPPGAHTQMLKFTYPCAPPGCSTETTGAGERVGTAEIKLVSNINFSSPELPGRKGHPKKAPPRTGPPCRGGRGPTCADKLFAERDASDALGEMDMQCSLAVLSLAEVIGSVERGTTSLAEAESISQELAAGSDSACAMEVLSFLEDLKSINDPPAGGLHKIAQPVNPKVPAARLPACKGPRSASRTLGESVRADELRYLATVRRGASIDAALLTTVDRVSGAYRGRDGSALNLQVRHAADLRSQLKAAHGQARAARRAIGALLKARDVRVILSAAQQQRGLGKALSKMPGVSQARLEQVARVRLAAAPIDVVAQLSR
jgi:hypothetical protein